MIEFGASDVITNCISISKPISLLPLTENVPRAAVACWRFLRLKQLPSLAFVKAVVICSTVAARVTPSTVAVNTSPL